MNNDPFKKMDLNFDPTVESEVKPTPTPNNENKSINDIMTKKVEEVKIEDQAQVEAKQVSVNEYSMKQQEAILSSIDERENEVKDLDKTLEFVVQEDKLPSNLSELEKKQIKKAKVDATKSRNASYFWISIMVLSIIFGVVAIWEFIDPLISFIKEVTPKEGEEINNWEATKLFFVAFARSFEAFLFAFFIFFSLKMFNVKQKPWKEWYLATEPERIANELKDSLEKNKKLRESANKHQVSFTPEVFTGSGNKEKLEHYKKENKTISDLVKTVLAERKQKEKAAKASQKEKTQT